MAENLGDKFATMSEDERRRFALEQDQAGEAAGELDFGDPRSDHVRTKADLEDRDGHGALVDDRQHEEGVRKEAQAREEKRKRGPE